MKGVSKIENELAKCHYVFCSAGKDCCAWLTCFKVVWEPGHRDLFVCLHDTEDKHDRTDMSIVAMYEVDLHEVSNVL